MSVHIGEGSLEIAGNIKAVKRSRPGAINTASYSVMSLFAAGEQGVWFDPSDFSTLFPAAAYVGDKPAIAVGQTIGLVLDKSQGLAEGTEERQNFIPAFGGTVTAATYNTSTGEGTAVRIDGSNMSFVSLNGLTAGSVKKVVVTNTGSANITIRTNGTISVLATATPGQTVTCYVQVIGTGLVVAPITDGTSIAFTIVSVKEVAGNHAYQATLAQRPLLGRNPAAGTRNLLTRTEELDNGVWTKTAAGTGTPPTVTPNAAMDPWGQMTADLVAFDRGAGTGTLHSSLITASFPTVAGQSYTASIYAKAGSPADVGKQLGIRHGANGVYGIVTLTNEWVRVSRVEVVVGTLSAINIVTRGTFTADAQVSAYLVAAQAEPGTAATAYQRVGASFDVTEAGVQDLYYLLFDGTDDGMVTNTITPGTDKAQVFAGVRKLSDAAIGTICETSTSSFGTNGAVGLFAPVSSATPNYSSVSRGTAVAQALTASSYPAPDTRVLSAIADISGDLARLRVNGAQVASAASDQGTGNYLAYPLYIGRRGGAIPGLPLNGRIYSLILRFGPNLDSPRQTESYVSAKTGVSI